jgi:L-fuconolactonase
MSEAAASGILDSHHHLWDTRALRYPLFDGVDLFDRRFGLDDYVHEAHEVGIVESIVVEAASAGPDGFDELLWLLDEIGDTRSVRGLVAWAPLERPDVDAYLARVRARAQRLLVGVRRSFEFEDASFAARPEVIDGARCAGAHELVVDLVLYARSLPAVLTLAEACPGTSFVLDHLGKPPLAEGGLDPWAAHLRELAEHSNVMCKLSGLPAEAASERWTSGELAPYIDHAIACFGYDRLMFGTDWPVLCRRGSISRWSAAVADRLEEASEEDRAAVFRTTAARVYGLTAA